MARVSVSLWERWVRLLATREDPLPLAVVRVAVAVVVLIHVSHVLIAGVDALVWVDARFGGLRSLDAAPFADATPQLARGMAFATIAASAMMALGLWTRLATMATYLGFRWLADLNGATRYSDST